MSEHTKGPWTIYEQPVADKDEAKNELGQLVDGTEFRPMLYYIASADGLAPAVTGCGPRSAANARLIAAAPELLDALQAIIGHPIALDMGDDDSLSPIWEQARAALAKATGGQS